MIAFRIAAVTSLLVAFGHGAGALTLWTLAVTASVVLLTVDSWEPRPADPDVMVRAAEVGRLATKRRVTADRAYLLDLLYRDGYVTAESVRRRAA